MDEYFVSYFLCLPLQTPEVPVYPVGQRQMCLPKLAISQSNVLPQLHSKIKYIVYLYIYVLKYFVIY